MAKYIPLKLVKFAHSRDCQLTAFWKTDIQDKEFPFPNLSIIIIVQTIVLKIEKFPAPTRKPKLHFVFVASKIGSAKTKQPLVTSLCCISISHHKINCSKLILSVSSRKNGTRLCHYVNEIAVFKKTYLEFLLENGGGDFRPRISEKNLKKNLKGQKLV